MMGKGIIGIRKAVRTALLDASRVASMLTVGENIVTEIPEKRETLK